MHKSVSASIGLLFWCRNKGNGIAEKMLRGLRVNCSIENNPMWPLLFRHIFSLKHSNELFYEQKGEWTRVFCKLLSYIHSSIHHRVYCLSLFPRCPLAFQIFLLCTSACLTSTSFVCTLLLVVFPLTSATGGGNMNKLLLSGPRASQLGLRGWLISSRSTNGWALPDYFLALCH